MVEAALHQDETIFIDEDQYEDVSRRPFDYNRNTPIDDNMYLTERAGARGRRSNLKPSNSYPLPAGGSGGGSDLQILQLLKQVLHEQKEQRVQICRVEAILQTKFLIEEANMSSLVSTVPHVKLDQSQVNDEAKEDDVGLVFKNDSDDDTSSDDEEDTAQDQYKPSDNCI